MTQDFFDDMAKRDAAERRAKILREAEARNAAEAAAEAIRQKAATEFALRVNRAQLLREYHQAGVQPPATKPDGTPLVSLRLLQSLGWSIERVGGENILVEPARKHR